MDLKALVLFESHNISSHCALYLLASRAATKALHFCLSRVSLWIECQVKSRLFSSLSPVCHQVFLECSLFCFSSGVRRRAVLVMSSGSFFSTWPIHLNLLFTNKFSMLSWWHLSYSSSFESVLGQKMWSTHLRFLCESLTASGDSFLSFSTIQSHTRE